MRVIFHRHAQGNIEAKAFSARWRHKLHGPSWSHAQVSVDRVRPWERPNSRDWLTIEHNGAVEFLGRVMESPFGAGRGPSGALAVDPMTVEAGGFLDVDLDLATTPSLVLGSDTGAASAASDGSVGTLFSTSMWVREAERLARATKIGQHLQPFLKLLLTCQLPPTLSGAALGDKIFAAYDDATAFWSTLGPMEPVQGWSVNGGRTLGGVQSKVAEFLLGTFQPNSQLIELTPMLVNDVERKVKTALVGLSATSAVGSVAARASLPSSLYHGTSLVVRLRMSPFRTQPLDAAQTVRSDVDWGQFSTPSWAQLYRNVASNFTRLNSRISGTNEVSAATAWLSLLGDGEANKLLAALGLPIRDDTRVIQDGFRLATITWPFVPLVADRPTSNLTEFTRLMAATLMQFQAPGAFFESGTAVIPVFDPSYKVGTVVEFPFPEYGADPTNPKKPRTLTAYITEVEHAVASDDSGHIEGSTTVSFERGLWDDRLRNPVVDVRAPVSEALQSVAEDAPDACHKGAPAGDFPKSDYDDDPSFPGHGRGAFTPFAVAGANFKQLRWLRRFFANAMSTATLRSVAEELLLLNGLDENPIGPFASDIVRREIFMEGAIASCAAAKVIELYWRQTYKNARVRVTSWYRGKEIGPGGWLPGLAFDGHHEGWAFDFYVDPGESLAGGNVSALRTWAGLKRLATENRIPWGGFGLYLNVNPTTGIQGTTQALSGRSTFGPAGGSSGVHYDTRGYFHRPTYHGPTLATELLDPATWGAWDRKAYIAAHSGYISVDTGFSAGQDSAHTAADPKYAKCVALNAKYDAAIKKSTSWLATDWTGDGNDEFELASKPTPALGEIENVLRNIADPERRLNAYARSPNTGDPDLKRFDDMRDARAAYQATYAIIADAAGSDSNAENARVGVRDAVDNYYRRGGWSQDTEVPKVGDTVPSMTQVLLNESCFAGPVDAL